jgi:hypothetical protein
MRVAAIGVIAAGLMLAVSCGQQTELASEPGPESVADVSSPSETAPETALAEPAGGPCLAGFLPLTGLCADPATDRFTAINTELQPFDPACVWKTVEISVTEAQALLFRTQDCSAKGWDADAYRWENGAVWTRPASMTDDGGVRSLSVFDLTPGQTAEQYALGTLEAAPPEQQDHCIIETVSSPVLAGRAFQLSPTPELLEALETENQGEPFDACGPYGMTDAAQVWEGRETRALFHGLGQDDPMWDPASYTFYTRGPDGVWRKEGDAAPAVIND